MYVCMYGCMYIGIHIHSIYMNLFVEKLGKISILNCISSINLGLT